MPHQFVECLGGPMDGALIKTDDITRQPFGSTDPDSYNMGVEYVVDSKTRDPFWSWCPLKRADLRPLYHMDQGRLHFKGYSNSKRYDGTT